MSKKSPIQSGMGRGIMAVDVTKMNVDIEKPTLKLNLIADSSGFLRTCSEAPSHDVAITIASP